MKTSYKIITSIFFLIVVSFGVLYALNGIKSPKLPWQGTPNTTYDSVHNVGSSYSADTRFTFTGSNTIVVDSITGLSWQSYKSTGSTDYIANYAVTSTWVNAKAYCAGLSLGGYAVGTWRLPTVKELNSIVDFSKTSPSIDTGFFGAQAGGYYWSSTPYASNAASAWMVVFDYGGAGSYTKTIPLYVRCVR